MKKGILKFFVVLVLAISIGFSFVQLRSQVVLANGCPSNPYLDCNCNLIDSVYVQYGEQGGWRCTYGCLCVGGSGEHFYIERTAEFPD